MGQTYNEVFLCVIKVAFFFLLSDTVRDKQRASKKKGEEEVRETRLVVAALLTVYAGLP